jgi:hypothetical protein
MAKHIEDGKWYDLSPPALIGGKRFPRVRCEVRFPLTPTDYLVSGVPEGGDKEEFFCLKFTIDSGVVATPSDPPSPLHEIQWN